MSLSRVLIVDDHKLFAHALARLLKGRFDVVGTLADRSLVIETVFRLRPDLVLLDLSTSRHNALETLRQLKARPFECKTVAVTNEGDAQLAVEALKAGASGVVLKTASNEEFLAAVEAVLAGCTYLTSALSREVLTLMSNPSEPGTKLTTRQREVLKLTVQGMRAKQIAGMLALSPRSVESVKYQLMQELNVHSTADLVRYAIRHDLFVA